MIFIGKLTLGGLFDTRYKISIRPLIHPIRSYIKRHRFSITKTNLSLDVYKINYSSIILMYYIL